MNTARFSLIQDDDCHWYLVPAEKREDAREYFQEVYEYWEHNTGQLKPDKPEWLQRIDGPHRLTFTDPQEV